MLSQDATGLNTPLIHRTKNSVVEALGYTTVVALIALYVMNGLGEFFFEGGFRLFVALLSFIVFNFLLKTIMHGVLVNLRLDGDITISNNTIIVQRDGEPQQVIGIDGLHGMKVKLNYIKRNDIQPRDILNGNNNFIIFKKGDELHRYEFMIRTKEEELKVKELVRQWKGEGTHVNYDTVLADL